MASTMPDGTPDRSTTVTGLPATGMRISWLSTWGSVSVTT